MLKKIRILADSHSRWPEEKEALINTEYLISVIHIGYSQYCQKETSEVILLEGQKLLMIGLPKDLEENNDIN